MWEKLNKANNVLRGVNMTVKNNKNYIARGQEISEVDEIDTSGVGKSQLE